MTIPMMQLMQQSTPNSLTLMNPDSILFSAQKQKSLVMWLNQAYQEMKQQRSPFERKWYINLAFYRGRQNIALINTPASSSGFRLLTPPAPPWRVRMVINKIRPIIRREIAKVTAQKPSFTVVPATNEDEDYYAAKVGEQVLESCYHDYEIPKINRSRAWWTALCGTGFNKCYWDDNKILPDKGKADPFTGRPQSIKGDICVQNVIPLHIYVPDLMEQDINNQPYVFHVFTKTKEWIELYYGVQVSSKVKTRAIEGDILENAFFDISGLKQVKDEQYLCIEAWIKPGGHKLFPQGGMALIIGDQLVKVYEQYPYSHGEYPFIKFDHIPSGQFYGHSTIEDLIPLQKELNRTRSQIVEAKNLMAKPKLLYAKGSIEPNKITTEPGQAIPYEPGLGTPIPLPMSNLPAYVSEEVMRINQDMDDISGQHEISRGTTPSQVTAATAISYLQEQDDTLISETISNEEDGMAKLGRMILIFAIDYWNEERLIKVAGKDESFDVMYLKGSKLRGNTDVRVEAGSALPSSKAARQALLVDLYKMGVWAQNPSEFLRIMDLRGLDKVLADYKVDISQAQRENIKMAAGMQININDFDNHELHLEYHNRYSKTQEYEMLPDQVKALIVTHREQHQKAIQVNQMFAARQQQLLGQPQPLPSNNPPVGAPQ